MISMNVQHMKKKKVHLFKQMSVVCKPVSPGMRNVTPTALYSNQDVGFVLIFSDLHLWASIFSVILANYIFMDGKSDYFQGMYFFFFLISVMFDLLL